jgi:exodeoxyribonuclease VII small subunit
MARGKGVGSVDDKISLEDIMQGRVTTEQVAKLSFEEALTFLEGVVSAVESGSLPLDQAIGSYERGTQLVQHLRALLSGAEEKLRVLGEE